MVYQFFLKYVKHTPVSSLLYLLLLQPIKPSFFIHDFWAYLSSKSKFKPPRYISWCLMPFLSSLAFSGFFLLFISIILLFTIQFDFSICNCTLFLLLSLILMNIRSLQPKQKLLEGKDYVSYHLYVQGM